MNRIATLLQAAGVTVIACGVGLWQIAAGVVVAGVGLVAFGIAAERAAD